MSYIEDISRQALVTAHADLVKGRRLLVFVVGLLALIHLMTVYPYLQISREISEIKARIETDDILITTLDSRLKELELVEQNASRQLAEILRDTTNDMIRGFQNLSHQIEAVQTSSEPIPLILERLMMYPPSYQDRLPPFPSPPPAPPGLQHQISPHLITPDPIQGLPATDLNDIPFSFDGPNPLEPLQYGLPSLQQIPLPNPGQRPIQGQASYVSAGVALPLDNDLIETLDGFRANAPESVERLARYARHAIVGTAYAEAESRWMREVRPLYLERLEKIEQTAQDLARQLHITLAEEADELRKAADDLAEAQKTIEEIIIRPDHHVDESLGSDWWQTVAGKGEYANAVTSSIIRQMQTITRTAADAALPIQQIREQQKTIHTALEQQLRKLTDQFDAQNKQLASLSGISGILPIDLTSFIKVFPMVIGVLVGLFILRLGQIRHDAAQAVAALAMANAEDRVTRYWLTCRLLGARPPTGAVIVTTLLAVTSCLWIILAAIQIMVSPVEPLVSTIFISAIGLTILFAGAAWDIWGIRRLNQARNL